MAMRTVHPLQESLGAVDDIAEVIEVVGSAQQYQLSVSRGTSLLLLLKSFRDG